MKVARKRQRRRTPDPRIRWTFEDGAALQTVLDHEVQMLELHARFFASEDPVQRVRGAAYLREVAALAARKRVDNFKASQPKGVRWQEGPRNPHKEKAKDHMRGFKQDGRTFEDFLDAWLQDPIDGLRLTKAPDGRYHAHDENEDSPDAIYQREGIRDWWTEIPED